ncbi:MAG: FkbM family methyltransferase [Chthoniobacteraceae bacterium]
MTPDQLNAALRQKWPGLHRWARGVFNSALMRHPALPCPALPRSLDEKRVWVHPRFCATQLDVKPHVRAWLARYLHTGSTFFDVGAYVGWHSIFAARIVGREGRVEAFEASPANAYYLDYHRRKNRLSQMEVVRAAVASEAGGELLFHLINGGDSTSNSIHCGEASSRAEANQVLSAVSVATTTLDAHAAIQPPDLVKIDVEGAELLVLNGAAGLMSYRRPPIILAAHPTWLPDGARAEEIFRLMHRREYEIYEPDGTAATRLEAADYLCLPNEYLS